MTWKPLPRAKRKLVYLKWRDASGSESGRWTYVKNEHGSYDYLCESVGWVMQETRTHISIAPHLGQITEPDDEQMIGLMHIPLGMIVRRVTLADPEKGRKP